MATILRDRMGKMRDGLGRTRDRMATTMRDGMGRTREYLTAIRENPEKMHILKTIGFILGGIMFIMIGYVLLDEQKVLDSIDDTKTSDLNKMFAWLNIVIGSFAILYTLYSVIKG